MGNPEGCSVSPEGAPPPPSYESLLAAGNSSTASSAGLESVSADRRASVVVQQPSPPSSAEITVQTGPTEEEVRRSARGVWQHSSSYTFACICCLLGMYNISRFAIMIYIYRGYFLFEFVVLTVILGIPFLYAMMTIGQYLGSGLLDMWYISPAFKGLGFAILYLYGLIGTYTMVPVAWLLVYFKDSFITARDHYKWGLCQPKFAAESCNMSYNSSASDAVGWTVPSYFHGRVLDRNSASDDESMGDLRFEIAFHLAILWLLIFLSLSRGLRSLGKVVYILGTLPIALLLLVAIRFIEQWSDGIGDIFSESGRRLLIDSVSWLLAAREVFLVWGVFGAAILHLSSHNSLNYRVTRNLIVIAAVTLFVLVLGSLLCVSAMQIITDRNLVIVPSSFENERFLKCLQPRDFGYMRSNASGLNLYAGSCQLSAGMEGFSGYQVMRLATEVVPVALALEGVRSISSFWAICFYGAMVIFALGQQVVLWFCLIESVVSLKPKILRPWQTIVTFVACNVGFLLGLPMTTNMGISLVFFFDFCVGALWWIVLLYLLVLVAVLFVRGHPYGTDQLVSLLSSRQKTRFWLLPALTFFWNVVLPVSFLVLSIAFLRWTPSNLELMTGNRYHFWPLWVQKVALAIQVAPLALSGLVCVIKAYSYLKPKSLQPLDQRIQAWCCPVFPPVVLSGPFEGSSASGVVNSAFEEDPPPKYTPPPSYSTATAKTLLGLLLRRASPDELEIARIASASIGLEPTALPEVVSYDPQPGNSRR